MLRSARRGTLPAALLLLLVALAGGGRALACSCAGQTPCEAYARANAVFVGTVASYTTRKESTEWEGERSEYTVQMSSLQVDEAFTDLNGATEVVVETTMDSSCGLRLSVGVRYMIYARRDEETGRFWTGLCSRTKAVEYAEEDLAYLRSAVRDSPGASVSGRVVYDDGTGDEQTAYSEVESLGVNTVVLEGGGRRREAHIAAVSGGYNFYGVPAGKYRLYVSLPDQLTDFVHTDTDYRDGSEEKDQSEVEIHGRGCVSKHFVVKDNGRISGRVLDENGEPAAHVNLNLIHITAAGEIREPGSVMYDYLTTRTDKAGNYHFLGLPHGSYLIGVRLARHMSGDGPEAAYPQTYYPGVPTRKQAVVVALDKGESVTGRDFQLQPRFAERRVSGRVGWRDGRPAGNVPIRYAARTPDRKSSDIIYLRTDAEGNFSFVGYEGTAYLVGAFTYEGNENKQVYAREIEVAPNGKVSALRLTLDQQGVTSRDYEKFQE
ncbi:MAG TPA: hypothetical protein VJ715_06850 [Pyrinomonadaceae bacterium]|nr:hypothetical protein [Pyrinomonadaceae bacterium]